MPPKRKQTARKTTGNHTEITSILSGSPSKSRAAKRVRHARLADTISLSDFDGFSLPALSPPPSCVPSAAAPMSSPDPLSHRAHASPARFNPPLSTSGPQPNGSAGALAKRHPPLDTPISVCIQFASWLESQTCVKDDVLLDAVERDGDRLLSLARATIMFDNALRGEVRPPVNGAEGALGEHARTLRVFAQLLKSKLSDGTLGEELEKAVLRDGEALLRLALCCLDFDRAIKGSS